MTEQILNEILKEIQQFKEIILNINVREEEQNTVLNNAKQKIELRKDKND